MMPRGDEGGREGCKVQTATHADTHTHVYTLLAMPSTPCSPCTSHSRVAQHGGNPTQHIHLVTRQPCRSRTSAEARRLVRAGSGGMACRIGTAQPPGDETTRVTQLSLACPSLDGSTFQCVQYVPTALTPLQLRSWTRWTIRWKRCEMDLATTGVVLEGGNRRIFHRGL